MHLDSNITGSNDMICLSHLRWNFVFQRPQHLMSRFAKVRRVFYIEEPVFKAGEPGLTTTICPDTQVRIVTPHLNTEQDRSAILKRLMSQFITSNGIQSAVAWFYTPMALEFVPDNLKASAIIYDCMDELSMFRGAPPEIQRLEQRLIAMSHLMFTGGLSLFEAKQHLHSNIHPFPSGVDAQHFKQARSIRDDFNEQAGIAKPRLGYAGVIDERMDLPLVEEVARRRPDWQVIMIGPTAKISPESLPRLPNIHWLGMKTYADLPKYFARWNAAIMPFALNDSTRFISPTKTPEFLAAGLPVISTAIRDVVRPYEELGLVAIAHSPDEFVKSAEKVMNTDMCLKWRQRSDAFLESLSWDSVWEGMNRHIETVLTPPVSKPAAKQHIQLPAFGVSANA